MLHRERGVVDVDSSFKPLPASSSSKSTSARRRSPASSAADIAQTLGMALHGATVSTLHTRRRSASGRHLRALRVRNTGATRASLGSIQVPGRTGGLRAALGGHDASSPSNCSSRCTATISKTSRTSAPTWPGRSSTYAVIDMLLAPCREPAAAGLPHRLGRRVGSDQHRLRRSRTRDAHRVHPDLLRARRALPFVHGPARRARGRSAGGHRRHAGLRAARAVRRLFLRDGDDRADRADRHRRAQLDHPHRVHRRQAQGRLPRCTRRSSRPPRRERVRSS